MAKTILRVCNGIELSEIQLNALKKILGTDDIEIVKVPEKNDLASHFEERYHSLKEAFDYLSRALPSKKSFDAKKPTALSEKKYAFQADDSVYALNKTLSSRVDLLIDLIKDNWGVKVKVAIEYLNRAEQYLLMKNGREDVATLSIFPESTGMPGYFFQVEKGLNPCTEETTREFDAILEQSKTQKADYAWLTHEQLFYFYHLPALYTTLPQCKLDLSQLLTSLRDPNWKPSAPHHIKLLNGLPKEVAARTKALEHIEAALAQMLTGGKADVMPALPALRKLPYWFLVMPKWEQGLLLHTLGQLKEQKQAVFFIPSRLRSVPTAANLMTSDAYVLSEEMNLVEQAPTSLRLSHPASRDVLSELSSVGEMHIERNLNRIVGEAKRINPYVSGVHCTSLISPSWLTGCVTYIGCKSPPDAQLHAGLQKGIQTHNETSKTPVSLTNHSQNYLKWFVPTRPDDEHCLQVIASANTCLKSPYSLFSQEEKNSVFVKTLQDLCELSVGFIQANTNNQRAFAQIQALSQHIVLPSKFNDVEQIKQAIRAFFPDANAADSNLHSLLSEAQKQLGQELKKQAEAFQTLVDWRDLLAMMLYVRSSNQEQQLKQRMEQVVALAYIVQEYQDTLNSKNTGNGRELFLASQESTIASLSGKVSVGFCVSGKDRKGLESIHTKVMFQYYAYYKQWPKYSDAADSKERQRFVDLMVHAYLSGHPHALAAQNAPGAFGIKTPSVYLPRDVYVKIQALSNNPNRLTEDDMLATTNEVREISKGSNYDTHLLQRIGELDIEIKEKLGRLFYDIVFQINYWYTNTSYKTGFYNDSCPEGILLMRKAFAPSDMPHSWDFILYECLIVAAKSQQKPSPYRQAKTKKFYSVCAQLQQMIMGHPNKITDDNCLKQHWESIKKESPNVTLSCKEAEYSRAPMPSGVLSN